MKKRGLVERCCIYAKAVTEPNRMKMMKVIGSAPPETMSVSAIAKTLGIAQPTATKHLQVLKDCGFLSRKKVGNTVYYSLDRDAILDFQKGTVDAFEKVWTPCHFGYNCDECPHAETCN